MKRPSTGSFGFTIIELLTVIAVMAAVSALMFPVIVRATESGKRTSCSDNLRQIFIATSLYAVDFDDTLPVSANAWDRAHPLLFPYIPSWVPSFQTTVGPYIRSRDVFRCPSDWGTDNEFGPYVRPSLFVAVGSSYRTRTLLHSIGLASVSAPAFFGLAVDDFNWHDDGPTSTTDRYNIVHFDGHVRFELPEEGPLYGY